MKPHFLMSSLAVFFAVAVGSPTELRAPAVIVERHLHRPGSLIRITLFDNRMAVTTVREGSQQVFFRQLTLPPEEYKVYLEVFTAVAETAGIEAIPRLGGGQIEAFVRLNVPGSPARTFRYSPRRMLDLPTTRLIKALDDLETRVAEVSPSHEALRQWTPRVGDRVRLFSGAIAAVSDIAPDGAVWFEHETGGLIEVVPANRLSDYVEAVLEDDP